MSYELKEWKATLRVVDAGEILLAKTYLGKLMRDLSDFECIDCLVGPRDFHFTLPYYDYIDLTVHDRKEALLITRATLVCILHSAWFVFQEGAGEFTSYTLERCMRRLSYYKPVDELDIKLKGSVLVVLEQFEKCVRESRRVYQYELAELYPVGAWVVKHVVPRVVSEWESMDVGRLREGWGGSNL